jgi:hypothetical protein
MSSSKYHFTVVVIPTRNRASIAKRAIRSVLDQPGCDVRVMVSDNSTAPEELEDLQKYCAELNDNRLRYVRPPRPLPMANHWEWAIQEALRSYNANHFLYLTDRMMFKPLRLKEVLDRVAAYPDKVLSYNHDRIVDDRIPIRIEQHEYTGELFEIRTLRLSYLLSQSIFPHAFPRMLNCVVPRDVLNRIQEHFGSVFASISPDFLFCCRCLELEETILFYDKSPIFHYALGRSHGASVSRGETTGDAQDFAANLTVDSSFRNHATPIPELITAANAIFNEYLLCKQETKSSRFFEVDLQKYLRVNAAEVSEFSDPNLKARLHALLKAHGLIEPIDERRPNLSASAMMRKLISPRVVWNKVSRGLKPAITGDATKPVWLFLARHFGVAPPSENSFQFDDLEQAIDYLAKFPRATNTEGSQLEEFLHAQRLPFPGGAEPEQRPMLAFKKLEETGRGSLENQSGV